MDVRVKFPNLYELFTILFGMDAESKLIDVYCSEKRGGYSYLDDLCTRDTVSLSGCFTWMRTEDGYLFWQEIRSKKATFEDLIAELH